MTQHGDFHILGIRRRTKTNQAKNAPDDHERQCANHHDSQPATTVSGLVTTLTLTWHPTPWDAPRRLVAVGPYRWVRNPIYLAALLVVLGEAWLFLSVPLLMYAGVMAILFHLFVIGYEERTLRRTFSESYEQYTRTVPRWIPRPPTRSTRPRHTRRP